jgi:hypothetical protein
MRSRLFRSSLGAAILCVLVPYADATTLYVANNALDALACGTKESPCRSITAAIAKAAPGDKIIVGPGRYGDLDRNGTLGGPGEEVPAPGCGCMLAVNKAVSLTSSGGAAATLIDARTVNQLVNVALFLVEGEFGRPGKGFTVTATAYLDGKGIVIDSGELAVRGNQVVQNTHASSSTGAIGIDMPFPQDILVEGNQVTGWYIGIAARGAGNIVRRNQVAQNGTGIAASRGEVIGNVVTGNVVGLDLRGSAHVFGNAIHGNDGGIFVGYATSGVVERNNVFGNRDFGLNNNETAGLVATDNYWGAVSGPGDDPADDVLDGLSTTTFAPFATVPFKVKAPIKP